MKICGIVAEFNPLHNGHKYLIDQVKEQLKPDFLIVVMSGNFVQRGEIASFDKWKRTKMALEMGVDLIVELPFQYAVSSVDLFAKGAIKLLNELHCTDLVFGTEDSVFDYIDAARKIVEYEKKGEFSDYSKSYATQINEFYEKKLNISVKNPNQMLGLNYAIQIVKNNFSIQVVPINRISVSHDSNNVVNNIASASLIREKLRINQNIKDLMPTTVNQKDMIITDERIFELLKYKVIASSAEELANIYQMNEGIENRLKEVIFQSTSLDELLQNLKSKRYTFARLRRLMLYTVLNVTDEEVKSSKNFIHILGFNKLGREYLNQYKKEIEMPIITKVSKDVGNKNGIMNLQIRVDSLITMFTNIEQNFKQKPEME